MREIKVGDVFNGSFGYDQTKNYYYQVIALRGKTQVVVRQIAKTVVDYSFHGTTVKCVPGAFLNTEDLTRKIHVTPQYVYIDINSVNCAFLMDDVNETAEDSQER